jgi:hypothetical protein
MGAKLGAHGYDYSSPCFFVRVAIAASRTWLWRGVRSRGHVRKWCEESLRNGAKKAPNGGLGAGVIWGEVRGQFKS